jgi:hypothetical protein
MASLLAGAIVLVGGLFWASGSSVFAPGYVHYWLEVLWLYPSGMSMLPISKYTEGAAWSYVFIVLFLGTINSGLIRLYLETKNPGIDQAEKEKDPLIACISLLGAFYLIYYIGRSHPYLIFQLSSPFCIVAVWNGQRLVSSLKSKRQTRRIMPDGAIAAAATLIMLAGLLLNSQFRTYPNFLNSYFNPAPRDVSCYFADLQDVCVPTNQSTNLATFQQTVSEMKTITQRGESFAIIADDDTSLYVASRSTLWNRYTPLLPALATKSMLDRVDSDLAKKTVDFVFLMKYDPFTYSSHPIKWRLADTTESWMRLAATTRRCYRFDHVCGAYEVWRR